MWKYSVMILIAVQVMISAETVIPLLKSGQEKSYDNDGNLVTNGSIKDDGYYQKGATRNYSRRSSGVVIDHVTGLEWQDNMHSVEKRWLTQENYNKCTGQYGETQDTSKCYDTSDDTAATYCSELTLDGAGKWRLPTIKEMLTLKSEGYPVDYYPRNVFDYATLDKYWVQSDDILEESKAWWIDFQYGMLDKDDKNAMHYVRCVRGSNSHVPRYSREGTTQIVTDLNTHLQWQDDSSTETSFTDWEAAIDLCENYVNLGGYHDWRLPNETELLSIIEFSFYDPALSIIFKNFSTDFYWTSTSIIAVNEDKGYFARQIRFKDAYTSAAMKPSGAHVRCVRGGGVQSGSINPAVIMYLLN